MNHYRFAVTGAQGVGKSTLAESLYRECSNTLTVDCTLLSGIGDLVREHGYPLGSKATPDTIFVFAAEHLKRERECRTTLAIQDRCMLDLLAYSRRLTSLSRASVTMLEQVVLASCTKLRGIFYVPIIEVTRETKDAAEDLAFRSAIAAEIKAAASDLHLVLHEVVGTKEERLDTAFRFVKETLAVDGALKF